MRGINRVRAFIPPDVWDRLYGPKKSVPPEPNAEERKPRYRTEILTGGCELVHLGAPCIKIVRGLGDEKIAANLKDKR